MARRLKFGFYTNLAVVVQATTKVRRGRRRSRAPSSMALPAVAQTHSVSFFGFLFSLRPGPPSPAVSCLFGTFNSWLKAVRHANTPAHCPTLPFDMQMRGNPESCNCICLVTVLPRRQNVAVESYRVRLLSAVIHYLWRNCCFVRKFLSK